MAEEKVRAGLGFGEVDGLGYLEEGGWLDGVGGFGGKGESGVAENGGGAVGEERGM